MTGRLDDKALDALFREARTHNAWRPEPIPDAVLRELYETARMAPTAANCGPARFVFVTSAEAKEKLASVSSGSNQAKIKAAPVTVIIGYDLDFPDFLPRLFPHAPGMKNLFADPLIAEPTAFRNSSLQGAYLILAARALGLDCGPMSGFDNGKVDALFFAGTRVKSNFICSLGYGDSQDMHARLPRLAFEEACRIL